MMIKPKKSRFSGVAQLIWLKKEKRGIFKDMKILIFESFNDPYHNK